ncbi:MAG TPA: DNA-directed RNA polymerase subunit alpha C-terminal domain-containing protein, partial [Clostridia bacterium]|nr:DNA-directed RNA polymerase subunit alpha C-terminal domain-containing protein [Clostridia bacterium]
MSNNKNNKFVKPNQDYMPDGDSAMLQKSIDELGLSEFTSSKLKAVEIDKIIDLCRCQMRHMYKIPGMNKKSVFEVLKKMQNVGLDFKRSPVAATTMEEVEKQPNQTANVAANANAKAKNNKDN